MRFLKESADKDMLAEPLPALDTSLHKHKGQYIGQACLFQELHHAHTSGTYSVWSLGRDVQVPVVTPPSRGHPVRTLHTTQVENKSGVVAGVKEMTQQNLALSKSRA